MQSLTRLRDIASGHEIGGSSDIDVPWPTHLEIEAAASALRIYQMIGRISRKWADLPMRDRQKWKELAKVALDAAALARVATP